MIHPSPGFARILAVVAAPLAASAAEFGTLQVTQLANNNNALSTASPGIALAAGPGSSAGGTYLLQANRADYNLDFGRSSDIAAGVLVSSVAELLRNDSAKGGPAAGDFNATSSFGINAETSKYWIAIHWAEADDNLEANYNVSYAYLPYDQFPGGVASNAENGGELTLFTGSPGLALDSQLTDDVATAGIYHLDLSGLAADAAQHGVLLVTGAKNEDNHALSRANADGSFDLFCHDNGANGASYENDGVGFSYLSTAAVGTNRLAAIGRVNGDGSTDVAAGTFTVTKGPKGRWFLQIPGQSQATGTLIVSPEGGDANNVDNIVAAAWDAPNSRWIIESRDLSGVAPQTPGLQDMARVDEDVFSFAFFQLDAQTGPPTITAQVPANEAIKVPQDAPLTALASDPDGGNLTVSYHGRRVAAVDPAGDFSVAALPDTQFYSENTGGNRAAIFSAQTDWIVAERESRNIGFVLHLGDITQRGDNPATADGEWANASNAMYRLENPSTTQLEEGVPYIMAVGNHDQTPIGDADGTSIGFNTFFGVHPDTGENHFRNMSYYGGTSEPSRADNNYTLFTAGGIDFIVISLEYDTTPDSADLNWADSLLKAHPARRGIVITHHMVNTGNPANFSTLGSAIYQALKDNPNLILMHGGHVAGEGRRSDTFEGRTVHSILADYQGRSNGGDGWLRIMKFRPALNRVEVQTYSPTLDQWETDADSQFSLNVNLKGGMGPFTEIGRMVSAPGNATMTWQGLEAGTRYEWYATVSDGTTTVSTPVRSFVTSGVLFSPTVDITAPANGALHASPANVALQAAASDLDGTVVKVQFYSGTQLLGEDSSAPYSFAWNGVPTGSYTVIAKAIDNDGGTTSSAPVSVQVVTEPPAPDVSTASAGLISPNWVISGSSASPRQFTAPGSNVGDIAVKINGTAPAFLAGVTPVTNWESPANGAAISGDNISTAYADANGKVAISVLDNSNPNVADSNPAASEESAGVSAAFLPYSGGWIGASVSTEAVILGKNLPAGVEVRRSGDGVYTISGLAITGNMLAFANGNGGASGDNVVSVRRSNGQWQVDVRDNAGDSQNGDFSFLYVPAATPGVLSGMINQGGSITALSERLSTLGATGTKTANYFQLQFGDGTVINPSNCALFLTGDSGDSMTASENIVSYSGNGNAFRIYSQDLPELSGGFQATDIRFVAIPFGPQAAQVPSTVSVVANDANCGEYGGDRMLRFTFTRTGSTTTPLQVTYATGGTATPGADFSTTAGTIQFPAGIAFVELTVHALSDSSPEGDETVTISVIGGDLYHLGANALATGVIQDRPLQAYLHAGGMSAPEEDDDGDGVENILEYYLGTAAGNSSGAVLRVQGRLEDGSYTVRFPHAKSATDVIAIAEWSDDLVSWHLSGETADGRTAAIVTRIVSPAGEDPETLEAVLTFSPEPPPAGVYVRLRVSP
ncbi:Ig-like domain-containing protein [Luteolibacter sp. Populi]|uniref:Ig-like domain-containing protein n=1 Tax=Luteolibacter sp. Populi TaxID=3230487 RepID=UPI003466A4FB